MKYDFASIEDKWQGRWASEQTFRTPNPGDTAFNPRKKKFYVLDMFPYPSGVGLHVGHPLGYIATDIVARYKRMTGHNVLHPMGYDAFGLPAEQFAVEHGVHPAVTTDKNMNNMTRQLKRLGLSYDWDRAIATTDPAYYKWTQWIFLQLYHSYAVDGVAKPITELVQRLNSEKLHVGPNGELIEAGPMSGLDAIGGVPPFTRRWADLNHEEQQAVLDEHRLAFMAEVDVNWCPALGTVLANEEVTNEGRSERGNHPVFKRPLKQWMLRITSLADRLVSDLDHVAWPEPVKLMQRNWIGKSTGAYVDFAVAGGGGDEGETIRVFTTRPDTLFGATYMVLAPEHPLVDSITVGEQYHAVNEYQKQTSKKADADRAADDKSKTGVFTGAYAVNPVNNEKIPIWIADYVMMGYGTGAIMAVPAHDERDHAFATTYKLPIVQVVSGSADHDVQKEAWTGKGDNIHSTNNEVSLNGLPTDEAKRRITDWLESKGLGSTAVQYKLRDWLFSRQRYWGEPFPILHGPNGEVRSIDEKDLPVELPPMEDFRPSASDDPNAPPQPPLSRAPDSWKYVDIDGVRYTREFNTMPQWAGSCWYYLRFLDPHNHERFVSPEVERYWMLSEKTSGGGGHHSGGVDLYVGGVEHAVLHLLYARFWHKVLFDLGHVSTPEPFGRLFNQGYIQAHAYTDPRGVYVNAEQVREENGRFIYEGQEVRQEFGKMGKSLKNAVAPDDVCTEYGCDTLRLYEMSMGPLDQSKTWNTRDISGSHRFLQRVWRLFVDEETNTLKVADAGSPEELNRMLHKTIHRVSEAMERMTFNTAIAALIEFNNELVKRYGSDQSGEKNLPRDCAQTLVLLLAPLAPHVAEELWQRLGHEQSLAYEPWPTFNPALLVENTIEIPVQVNGKLRSKVTVPADADDKTVESAALADEKTKASIGSATVRKVIVVKGKMVNIVAK
ncbi:MAG: leucine--tRNA ligase [Phycisphaera sp.]|nr:leucine--tRNA ligase [Phycisphaera sp.]